MKKRRLTLDAKGGNFMRYFDLHCDTIGECFRQNQALSCNQLEVSLQKASGFRRWGQVFAIWLDDTLRGEQAVRYYESVLAVFQTQMWQNRDRVRFCKSADDLICAVQERKTSAFLSVEGCAVLNGDVQRLKTLYEDGVRLITLTWNGANELGDGIRVPDGKGLTEFGREAVQKMERLGILVDVSHLSDAGFWDVAEHTTRPFVASHSNLRAVCGDARNLTDDQAQVIRARGGLIGLNLHREFLDDAGIGGMDTAYAQVYGFLERGCAGILAAGADYDGAELHASLTPVSQMHCFYEYLLKKGLKEQLLGHIFYENAYEFFKRFYRPFHL